MSVELKRVNLRMSQELYAYFKEKADEMGVPYSNLIIMALSQYKKQDESVSVIANAMDMFKNQGVDILNKVVPKELSEAVLDVE